MSHPTSDIRHPTTYLIIGNSAAAIGAIEAIRKYDQENSITVISAEPYLAYSRPLISYFLAGKVSGEKMYYRDQRFYRKNKVEAVLGKKAVAINTDQKIVSLEDGTELRYDKLLIATGGIPFVPPMAGLEKARVFTFTSWDEVKRVAAVASEIKKVVVVGGGLIGLKAAESLRELGIEITVVELADRILSPALDAKASRIVEKHLRKQGIEIITNNTVSEIIGPNDEVAGVILKDGKRINCQAAIIAIGVVPNVELVRATAIKINRGIIVDEQMQTSVVDIYAAGDVAEAPEMLSGEYRVIPIWPGAFKQGSIAGSNMAGHPEKYPGGLAMNSLEFFGLACISVGLINPEGEEYEVFGKYYPKEFTYKKIVLKDDVIVGAIFVGAIEKAGIVTGLIRDRVNVKNFKEDILEDDFGYVSFPKKLRTERLRV